MKNALWLVDKLPMPLVIHHQNKIEQCNAAFTRLLSDTFDKTHFDFMKWLLHIIPNKKQSDLIKNAIIDNKECSIQSDVSFKGVSRQWIIFTAPLPNADYQLTYLYDESVNKISKSYWELHTRISKATMQLIKEINERKKAEKKAAELSTQLIEAARRAGMSDIATSTLHNVGNILNTVNTSLSLITQEMRKSELANLVEIVKLLDQRTKNQQAQDEKLAKGLEYLSLLCVVWEDDKQKILQEAASINKNMDYINKIITTQQTLSNAISRTEEVSIQDIISDALTINKLEAKRNNIEIIKNFKFDKKVVVDRIKLLQILANLIRNAIDSVTASQKTSKRIILNLFEKDHSFVIQVIDNGLGISAENKTKIYNYGFTTKKNGHGFGLHSSALSAKEMGGLLAAESEGENEGATFILTLPLEINAKEPA